MFKKIIIGILLVILLFFISSLFLAIRFPIYGEVIDSVTGKPIPNLSVERMVYGETGNIQGSTWGVIKSYKTKTDSDGKFSFRFDIFPLLFLTKITGEDLSINIIRTKENAYNTHDISVDNVNYYQIGRLVISSKTIEYNAFNPFNNIKVELSPKMAKVEDCNNDENCLIQNAIILALQNKDENLCLMAPINLKFPQSGPMACISVIADFKNDKNICNLIDELGRKYDKELQELRYKYADNKEFCINSLGAKEINCSLFINKEQKELCESLFK